MKFHADLTAEKFVATETHDHVGVSHCGSNAARDVSQQAVTRIVPTDVVDGLEVVDVDEREHEGRALGGRARQLNLELAGSSCPDESAGQFVDNQGTLMLGRELPVDDRRFPVVGGVLPIARCSPPIPLGAGPVGRGLNVDPAEAFISSRSAVIPAGRAIITCCRGGIVRFGGSITIICRQGAIELLGADSRRRRTQFGHRRIVPLIQIRANRGVPLVLRHGGERH